MNIFLFIIPGTIILILILAIVIKPKEEHLIEYSWNDTLDPACITHNEILNKNENILLVYHDYGPGGWQFYDGKDVSNRDPIAIEKVEILKLDPSLYEIIDLETGWKAERASINDGWIRSKIKYESFPKNSSN